MQYGPAPSILTSSVFKKNQFVNKQGARDAVPIEVFHNTSNKQHGAFDSVFIQPMCA